MHIAYFSASNFIVSRPTFIVSFTTNVLFSSVTSIQLCAVIATLPSAAGQGPACNIYRHLPHDIGFCLFIIQLRVALCTVVFCKLFDYYITPVSVQVFSCHGKLMFIRCTQWTEESQFWMIPAQKGREDVCGINKVWFFLWDANRSTVNMVILRLVCWLFHLSVHRFL